MEREGEEKDRRKPSSIITGKREVSGINSGTVVGRFVQQ